MMAFNLRRNTDRVRPKPITHKAQYREHDELLHLCSADFSPRDTRSATLFHYKRPLLLESQNNHTPVKLKHFTYTCWRQGQNHRERYDEHCHPSTMRVLISLRRVHSTTERTDHHLRHPKHTLRMGCCYCKWKDIACEGSTLSGKSSQAT